MVAERFDLYRSGHRLDVLYIYIDYRERERERERDLYMFTW
jgi:hypothetical protein